MPPTIGGVERAAPAVSALAVSLALIALVQQLRRRLQVEVPGGAGSSTSGSRSPTKDVPTSRTPAETAVRFSNKLSPEHADEHGRVYGGELLKIIDVASGTVAAKHAGGECVTISVDRVLFLDELRTSDIVHISAQVNRAWRSAMEIGVKVERESGSDGERCYAAHCYLTFVKRRPPPAPSPPPSSALSALLQRARALLAAAAGADASSTTTTAVQAAKPRTLPHVRPDTLLEQKRYILAGRRRAVRLRESAARESLLSDFRKELLAQLAERLATERNEPRASAREDKLIEKLEKEIILEAYLREDPAVHVHGDMVRINIDAGGDVDEADYAASGISSEIISMPLKEIQNEIRYRGEGGWRKLSVPADVDDDDGEAMSRSDVRGRERWLESERVISHLDTAVTSLWVCRPQFCNSKGMLFGGQLIRFVEEVSAVAARRVGHLGPWASAGVDSLTFKSSVHPGEALYITACVVKVWDASIECYAVAQAEDRTGRVPGRRLVSEAFFSLVAIDAVSGRPLRGKLKHVRPEGDAAARVATRADARRADRLADKNVLLKLYA